MELYVCSCLNSAGLFDIRRTACLKDLLSSLVQVYTRYVLSPGFNMTGSDSAIRASKTIMKEMSAQEFKRRVDSWTVTARPVPIQTSLLRIIHLLGNVYKDATIFAKCQHISLSASSDRWQGRLYSKNVATLLALDASAQDITLKTSVMPHPGSDIGFIRFRRFQKAK